MVTLDTAVSEMCKRVELQFESLPDGNMRLVRNPALGRILCYRKSGVDQWDVMQGLPFHCAWVSVLRNLKF